MNKSVKIHIQGFQGRWIWSWCQFLEILKIQDGESNMADEKNPRNFLFIIFAWNFLLGVADNRSNVSFREFWKFKIADPIWRMTKVREISYLLC